MQYSIVISLYYIISTISAYLCSTISNINNFSIGHTALKSQKINIMVPLSSHTVQTFHTATHTTYVIDSESQLAIGTRKISKVTSAHFPFCLSHCCLQGTAQAPPALNDDQNYCRHDWVDSGTFTQWLFTNCNGNMNLNIFSEYEILLCEQPEEKPFRPFPLASAQLNLASSLGALQPNSVFNTTFQRESQAGNKT